MSRHPALKRPFYRLGDFTQPRIHIRLRAGADHPWSDPIFALVDTGATITLIMDEYVQLIPGLADLRPDIDFRTATGHAERTRATTLDICLGAPTERNAIRLERRLCNFTAGTLVAPVLLGQRGALDALTLHHANVGPTPHFVLRRPQD